ncbi:DNA circularization N-terminal domain-containing protein [Acetobacter orientalis]|uniref:DNA circularization N-terminal domain-containing protein n=1 Tax=Acetobacter orientalis TaxID=146474 RepID=UPI00386BDAD2
MSSFLPVGSFRGAPFHIRDHSTSGMNRSFIIHEFPYQTTPYIEDLGANTVSFRISGFVGNDANLYMSRDILEAALRAKGVGELYYPGRGLYKAACVRAEIGERMDEKGLVQIEMEFVAATVLPQVPMTPLGALDTATNLLSEAMGGLEDLDFGFGDAANSMLSGVVGMALAGATTAAVSGIDDVMDHSTLGRYAQSPFSTTTSIKAQVKGSTDKQKFESAQTLTITAVHKARQDVSASLANALGGNS